MNPNIIGFSLGLVAALWLIPLLPANGQQDRAFITPVTRAEKEVVRNVGMYHITDHGVALMVEKSINDHPLELPPPGQGVGLGVPWLIADVAGLSAEMPAWEITLYDASNIVSIAKRTRSGDLPRGYVYQTLGLLESPTVWQAVKSEAVRRAQEMRLSEIKNQAMHENLRKLPSGAESLFSSLRQYDLFELMHTARQPTQFLPLAPGSSDAADRDRRWLKGQVNEGRISLDGLSLELERLLSERNYHGFLYACAVVADIPKMRSPILLLLAGMLDGDDKRNYVVIYGAAIVCGLSDDQLDLASAKAKLIESARKGNYPIAKTAWSNDLLGDFASIYLPASREAPITHEEPKK